MRNKLKIITLLMLTFTLSGCTLPLQSTNYPAWNTKGVLESYTLTDGRVVDGWLGASVQDSVSAKWYDFKVNSVEFVNTYEGYTAGDGNILIHANITITNTSETYSSFSNGLNKNRFIQYKIDKTMFVLSIK